MEPNSINHAVPIRTMTTDLMVEILIRLPDCQSALQCAAVCKEWLSLVTDPAFRLRFIEHHKQLNPRRKLASDILFRTNQNSYHNRILRPSESDSLNYFTPASHDSTSLYLSFLPGWPLVTLQSSAGDLLLVVLDLSYQNRLLVCNPITKRWTPLPDPPPPPPNSTAYYEITTEESSSPKYTVVVMSFRWSQHQHPGTHVAVFRSETGRWDQTFRWFQLDLQHRDLPFWIKTITMVGRLVYIPIFDNNYTLCKLVAIDTFSEPSSFRLPELPREEGFGIGTWWCNYHQVHIGAVRDCLRICQYHTDEDRDVFEAKIWELREYDYDNNIASWVLASEVSVENAKSRFIRLSVRAFHPQDDDVLFIMDMYPSDILWKYHIARGAFEKVGDFSCAYNFLAIVHPLWPSQISPLIRLEKFL